MSTTQKPHILIIGAGLGGLTLAQGLKKNNIPFHIYERDRTNAYRAQGYRIRLHGHAIDALRACLSDDLYELFERTCAEMGVGPMPSADPLTGEVTFGMWLGQRPGGPGGPGGPPSGPGSSPSGPGAPPAGPPAGPGPGPEAPSAGTTSSQPGSGLGPKGSPNHGPPIMDRPHTVDRTLLREILLLGLQDNMTYGKELSHFSTPDTPNKPDPSSPTSSSNGDSPSLVTLYFKDSTTATGTFLIGADGVRSRVRAQHLASIKTLDTGGRIIYGKTPLSSDFTSLFPAELQQRMSRIKDFSSAVPVGALLEAIRFPHEKEGDLTAQKGPKLPEDYMYWVLTAQKDSFPITDEELTRMSTERAARLAQELTAHWHPSLRALVEYQDKTQTSALRIMCVDPEMEAWTPSAFVTVIGDAAHVMPPTGASGAVTALRDAAALVKLFVEKGVGGEAVGVYEEGMRGYAKEIVVQSIMAGVKSFGQKGFESFTPVDLR